MPARQVCAGEKDRAHSHRSLTMTAHWTASNQNAPSCSLLIVLLGVLEWRNNPPDSLLEWDLISTTGYCSTLMNRIWDIVCIKF